MATKNKQKFRYVARRTADQSIVEGVIPAPSAEAVYEFLHSKMLIPIDVSDAGGSGLGKEISLASIGIKKGVKRKDVATWSRQFSTMIDAGLPVINALNVLSQQTNNPRFKEITVEIKESIQNGKSLAESMRLHEDVFGDLIINMIFAGEEGGFLDRSLLQIAKDLEAEVALKSKVKAAMTYPVVVMVMAIVMSAAMLIFIVPVFAKMFAEMGGTLPLPTRIMMNMSNFLKVGTIPMVIIGFLMAAWWKNNKNRLAIREFLDPKRLKVPVFGKLVTMIALARFSRNLSTLMGSGVPVLKCLDIVKGTVGNLVLERAIMDVRKSVSEGKSMSEPLRTHTVFPSMVVEMIAVGETSGSVEVMLSKIAEDYDQQVSTMTEQLASLIEPFIIVAMGIMIGAMVISLYMPIFSIYDLIEA